MQYAIRSLLLALLFTTSLRAASLPAEAVSDDAVFIVWVDARKLDPAQLSATAAAMLGDDAKQMEAPIKQLAAMRDMYLAAGGESVAIVVREPSESGRDPEPHYVLTFNKDADTKVMLELMTTMSGDRFEMTDVGQRILMVASRRQPSPPAGTAGERFKTFTKMLQGLGDAPAAVAFVPTSNLRQMVAQGKAAMSGEGERSLPGITKMFQLLEHVVAAEHGLITATLGQKAKLTLTITAKNAAAATALTTSIKPAAEAAAKLDAKIRQSKARIKADPGAALVAALLSDAQPKVEGSAVSIVLEDAALRNLGKAIIDSMLRARAAGHRAILASNMHQMMTAMLSYAINNRGKFPDTLEDLKPHISDDDKYFAYLLKHPATGESPAFKYIKPATALREVKNPSETGVLFELKDGKIDPLGHVAYADGHVDRPSAKDVEPGEGTEKEK